MGGECGVRNAEWGVTTIASAKGDSPGFPPPPLRTPNSALGTSSGRSRRGLDRLQPNLTGNNEKDAFMSDGPRDPQEPQRLPGPDRPHAEPITPILIDRPDLNHPGLDRPGEERFFPVAAPRPPRRRRALTLFVLTCLTTLYAGATQFAMGRRVIDPNTNRPAVELDVAATVGNGLSYATGVMVILLCHEMGHYLQARRYGVPASLPYFIPMPIGPFGTMGAVIVQQPGVADRKAMFDIAISGPLAGLVIALPLNWWAIRESSIGPIVPGSEGWTNPVVVEWMVALIHRPLGPGEDIALSPLLFAGWVGIFITALNLIPIGQLDGGHILYCLIGKRAHTVARWVYRLAVILVVVNLLRDNYEYAAWTLMLVLIGLMGTRHPPTADDHVPLGTFRVVLGWLTLAFILIGFVRAPTYRGEVPDAPAQVAPAAPAR